MWILIQGILSSEPEPPIDTENEDGDVNETWNQRNLRKGDKDVIEDDRTLASELSSLSTDSSSHNLVKCRYSHNTYDIYHSLWQTAFSTHLLFSASKPHQVKLVSFNPNQILVREVEISRFVLYTMT